MADADIYSQLVGGTDPTLQQQTIADALRRQRSMGLVAQVSGDPVLEGMGAQMQQGANQQAQEAAAEREKQQAFALQASQQAQEKQYQTGELSQQQAALSESIRQHNLEHSTQLLQLGIDPDTGKPDPTFQTMVDAIGRYDKAPLNASASRNPRNLNIMSAVYNQYPDYDDTFYSNKKKTVDAFGGGGPQGQTLRAADVGVQHLGVLGNAVTALNNGQIPLFNKVINEGKYQLGLSTAPTDFAATKKVVSDEIAKFVTATNAARGTAVFDRKEMEDEMNAANNPQMLNGVIQHWQGLMKGQIMGLKNEYEVNTRLGDFNNKLAPATRQYLGLQNEAEQQTGAPAGAGVKRVKVDAQGNVLGN